MQLQSVCLYLLFSFYFYLQLFYLSFQPCLLSREGSVAKIWICRKEDKSFFCHWYFETINYPTGCLSIYFCTICLSIYLSIANQFVNMDIYRYIHKWIGRYIYIIILYNFIDREGDGWTESVADRDLVRYRGIDR